VNRATKYLAYATTVVALGAPALSVVVPAGAAVTTPPTPAATTPQCRGAAVKPIVHADAVKREATLTTLVATLNARKDPYGLNGPQIAALQAANTGIAALDGQIASTCYPNLAALKTDATKLFVDYRVYWLRGPQTHAIQAADRLAEARTRLGHAAAKLAPLVGSNPSAQADLAAMNQSLSGADAKLGTPPTAGSSITDAAGLAPAADMTHDTAVLETARTDLIAAQAALAQARADGLRVVTDLQH